MGIIVNMKLIQKTASVLLAVVFFCTFLISGCAVTRQPLPVQLPDGIPLSWQADTCVEDLPITASLLDLIGEEQLLRRLIDEAMANNPNLRATALRLKAAGYMLSAPRSRLLPHVHTEFSKGRDNQGVDEETGKQKTADSHRLSLGVSWELDIWGRLANEHTASKQAVLAQEYEYLHIQDALAARVIQAWIEQVAIRRSLAIEKERVAVLQRIETVLIERYKSGIGNLDELSTAKSKTEIARADLSAESADLLQSIRKLEVLLGRYPKGEIVSGTHLPEVLSPPADVPATALLNRPDIRAALARVESARNISSAADKAILPQLRLSGDVFKQAASLNDFGGASTLWSFLGALFQPLFEGGRIISESRSRSNEAEASLMELHEVVLQALKEAEDAFGIERDLAAQSRALKTAVQESEKSSCYYEGRYLQGLDTIQSMLIAKEQEISVRIRLNEVMAERWSNRIDLALALGVGMNDGPAMPAGEKKP